MARTYTYDDFKKALDASGLGDQFSDSDLRLAERNPDAGMSLLSYKQDYNNATTDELRALAHAGAEQVRSSFGEYTGGGSGSGYKVTQMSPGGFEYSEAAPEYKNTYGSQVDDLMNEIMDQKEFTYDYTTDPLYSSYKKTYTREGQRATEDVLGDAAAMTGGIPSSYAVSAAAQAGNQYAAALADKVPELYDMAYQKYLNEYNEKLDRLQLLQDREQFEYSKYLSDLEKYETDKAFDYAQWLDEIESQANERSEALSKAYAAAEYGDYSQLEALGITPDYALLESLKNNTTGSASDSVTVSESDEVALDGGIDAETLAVLEELYPNGRISSSNDWETLLSYYGEDALKEAGYAKGDSAGSSTKDMEQMAGITQTEGRAIANDVYDLILLMESGDADIKTTDDIKNAIYSLYPKYYGNVLFEDYLNRMIAANKNAVKK